MFTIMSIFKTYAKVVLKYTFTSEIVGRIQIGGIDLQMVGSRCGLSRHQLGAKGLNREREDQEPPGRPHGRRLTELSLC